MTSIQQRAALQRQIWQIANDVRGSVDGWDTHEVINITKLNAELKTTVARIDQLRTEIDTIVEEIEGKEVNA